MPAAPNPSATAQAPRRPPIDAALHEIAESFATVDPVTLHAMSWATELGVTAVSRGAGAALRLLAAAGQARSVVEIGTGTGVSGLWLLSGMRPDGVLTSIDVEPEHQAMARQSFAAAGFATNRARLIVGSARQMLPRLADGAYDLMFVDGEIADYPACLSAAHRLLRVGGAVVVNNAFAVDLSAEDELVVREVGRYVRRAPEWSAALLTAGTGLLCATKRDSA